MFRKFAWYSNRLRVMSLAEIFHRVLEQVSLAYLRLIYLFETSHFDKSPNPENFKFCTSSEFQLPNLAWHFDLSSEEIHQLSLGQWHALSFPWSWRENSNCWHDAPDANKEWPQKFFNSIDYRPGNSIGDIRVAWEPARLQQLVCLSFLCSSDQRIKMDSTINLMELQLNSWVSSNPFLRGIHYISAMECALRIIAVCTAIDNLRVNLNKNSSVWVNLVRVVESHAFLIEKRLSLYSSRGNHTIAEAVGLLYAGLLFPEFKRAEYWVKTGKQILADEADYQILSDGGGAEQSFWYLLFISDLYGLAHKLIEKSGDAELKIEHAFQRASSFLSHMASTPGQLPDIGDRDDGYALSKFLRISFQESGQSNKTISFKKAGYTLIRPTKGIKLLFDHGALGMPPSYGHGHADALSIIMTVNQQEVLLDSGTFAYSATSDWRRYFRSTAAHNTITVDNQDQATYLNGFMWQNSYVAELIFSSESDNQIQLLAKHNGYKKLGVVHWRGILVDCENGFVVWDYLTGVGSHHLTLRWHICSDFRKENNKFIADLERPLVLSIANMNELQIQQGNESDIAGWKASQYGKKAPALMLNISKNGALPEEFYTYLSWGNEKVLGIENTASTIGKFREIIRESGTN